MKNIKTKPAVVSLPIGKDGKGGSTLIDADDFSRVNQMGIWSIDTSNGYVVKFVTDKQTKITRKVYLHRFIKNLTHGDGKIVDHYDGDPLNNSKSNLRVVSPAENSQNRRNILGGSVYRGVYFDANSNRWVGRVRSQGYDWSKSFRSEWEAAKETNLQRLLAMPFAKPDPYVMARLYQEGNGPMIEQVSKLVNLPQ